tara:strand:+ start:309 stop:719 length:411 start_codon:yes stop_codon:yes gene_type:complete
MEKEVIDSTIIHKLITGEFVYGFDYSKIVLPDTLPNGMILLKGDMNEEENLFTIYYKWNKIPKIETIKTKDYSQELKALQVKQTMIDIKPFKPVFYTHKEIVKDNSWNHEVECVTYCGLGLAYSLLFLTVLTKVFK